MDERIAFLLSAWHRVERRVATAMGEENLRRFRIRMGAGIAILLVVIVAVVVLSGRNAGVARWAPLAVIESREPLQELPIRVVGKSRARPSGFVDAELDLSNIDHLVIGVDLDLFKKTAESYEAIIENEGGDVLFRDRIPDVYFDDGRFLLRVASRRVRSGKHRLEIVSADTQPTLVALSVFDIKK